MDIFYIRGVECRCSADVVTIVNSSVIKDKDAKEFIKMLRGITDDKYTYKRSINSWTKELIAHNRLYKLGLFVDHTRDTDLEESESKLRLFAYNIIAFPYIF